MSTCVNPANQPIYQALLDKAATYPADKIYNIKAYQNAAQYIFTTDKDMSDGIYETIPGIGIKIEEFINTFVDNIHIQKPSKPVEEIPTQKPLWSTIDYTPYGPANPRRSQRLIGKPTPKYFNELDETIEIIQDICDKIGVIYTDELLNEFNIWFPTADEYYLFTYNYITKSYDIPKSKKQIISYWIKHIRNSATNQIIKINADKIILRYCQKYHIQYDPLMSQRFAESEWFNDSTYYVRKWFNTLKKVVVF